ncbi:nucleoside diphosphate kinase regulator [Marichromatium purpuratum 984]|uniref:Nucleoside diphosphate kinase regulator n=1 Tax=Marichromatium purpuratum 984 TaxID=765910 RepID=W0E0S0_MARPU|nr:nucleoside diphosphate kinase regulator [Marichromatium purpuratum]AHF02681.1 nucleoside diphosphate kinase regulator [Marichromatium purpuratum 984]
MSQKPPLIVSETDFERLQRLLDTLPADGVAGRDNLEEELERAEILESEQMPANVVTMNSRVRVRVSSSDETFVLTLVYPKDVDPEGGTVSILAPVGSALLGLAEGAEIDWPRPGGALMRVRIEEVLYQPERSGEYHR